MLTYNLFAVANLVIRKNYEEVGIFGYLLPSFGYLKAFPEPFAGFSLCAGAAACAPGTSTFAVLQPPVSNSVQKVIASVHQ